MFLAAAVTAGVVDDDGPGSWTTDEETSGGETTYGTTSGVLVGLDDSRNPVGYADPAATRSG